MDWIEDFLKRCGNEEALQTLKKDKFHGNIQINFCDGKVMNGSIHKGFRAVSHTDSNPNKGD